MDINAVLNAKINDCVVSLTIRTYESLISRYSRGLIRSISCSNGHLYINGVRVDDINTALYNREVWARILGWQYNGSYWFKDNIKFINMRNTIIEIFEENAYDFVDPHDRVVLDVGAYVGDSAIYFTFKGAKKIIAIEPHPGAYQEMLMNIRLNNMEDKIIPINAGLASRRGRIRIGEVCVDNTASTQYSPTDAGEVEAVTLENVMRAVQHGNNAILKMDC
jgi:FkbM family methyltransferase